MSPELVRISQLSEGDPQMVFSQLMHHFDGSALKRSYSQLSGKAAVGSDGISKAQYGEDLDSNISDLVNRLKRMGYRPAPVKEVMIPKEGKATAFRPLGIGNFGDKIVQKWFQEILEAIYEPLFLDCSYGFRRDCSCHDAVKALRKYLYHQEKAVVIDLDLKNYFGSIDHDMLIEILSRKITDKRFLRHIQRMLKSGILSDQGFRRSDEGVTQGSVCSPVLANIFAHYVLDEWLDSTVRAHCRSPISIYRYADDVVICCGGGHDAARILKALKRRLLKYGLELNEEKTKQIRWNKRDHKGSGSFDFLGFTFYLGLTRHGWVVPKLKSSGRKLRVKLCNVNLWCKRYRNEYRLSVLWSRFCAKLRGHVQYYGVSNNQKAVGRFKRKAICIFLKWLNRRSQLRSMTYKQFKNYMNLYPPPRTAVVHRLY